MLREGKLDDRMVEMEVEEGPTLPMFDVLGAGMDEMGANLRDAFSRMFPGKKRRRRMKVKEALEILHADETDRLVDMEKVTRLAIQRTEESGIIFIDEIDKIAAREGATHGAEVSREGVQRDLLPIVEGSTVNTKYGMVRTDHILFIASGAFHLSKPSDLVPELQGRFPIRVELAPLGEEEFYRILTEPKNALIRQYVALLATEGIDLEFTDEAIREIARIAAEVNLKMENIGARRLHTVMEKVVEELSFDAPDREEKKVVITEEYVRAQLEGIAGDEDLRRFIL